jgi:hypothetical protein
MTIHHALLPAAAALAIGAGAHAQITLTDQTAASGCAFTHMPDPDAIPGAQDYMPAGIAVGDYDRDGFPDIFWASGGLSPDHLFINNGDGTFTDEAAAWGVDAMHATCGACAGDYNDDGWVDIYLTSFGDGDDNQGQVGRNRLFRNNGDGTFTNVTGSAVVIPSTTWGFQTSFVDMDDDGFPELLYSADFGTSRYYVNDGNGSFIDFTDQSGTGLDQNGMGQCVADFNNDGRFDWYVTSIYLDDPQPASGEGNKLYINLGNNTYQEVALSAGVDDGGWGWGTVAVDLDHDTWVDIVEVNGRPGNAEFEGEQEYVFRNSGNLTFTEEAPACGLTFQAEGKSCSYLDYDRDGDMDIAITFNGDLVKLYRNDLADGNWLHLAFDTQNNPRIAPQGFGCKVTATAGGLSYVRYVDSGPNFLGTSETAAHFGLGGAGVVDELRIDWPRGYVTTLTGVAANQHLVIQSPALCDFNADGVVGVNDFLLLLSRWGPVTGSDRRADVDNDGMVGVTDFLTVLASWTP